MREQCEGVNVEILERLEFYSRTVKSVAVSPIRSSKIYEQGLCYRGMKNVKKTKQKNTCYWKLSALNQHLQLLMAQIWSNKCLSHVIATIFRFIRQTQKEIHRRKIIREQAVTPNEGSTTARRIHHLCQLHGGRGEGETRERKKWRLKPRHWVHKGKGRAWRGESKWAEGIIPRS